MARRIDQIDEILLAVANVEQGDSTALHCNTSLLVKKNTFNVMFSFSMKIKKCDSHAPLKDVFVL